MEDFDWILVKELTDADMWSPSSGSTTESSKPLEIRFNEPAKLWTDALPIGNGRLGAMVWGGVASETLNLNEDTLWTGIPGDYTDPDAPKALAEVRKLVDDGQYAQATEAGRKLVGKPNEVYQLVGDIKLEFDASHANYNEETYQRVLDLETATVKVKYSTNDIEFTREYFSSNPDQVIAIKISGNKPGSLNFTVSLDSQMHHHSYTNGKNQIIMEGSCLGTRIPPQKNATESPQGIQFSAVLDIQISNGSGALNVLDEQRLQVKGCDWAIILLTASSSFDGPFTKPSESKRDPISESQKTLISSKRFSYSEIYSRHVDDYQKLFQRVSLNLSKSIASGEFNKTYIDLKGSEDGAIPTSERVKSFIIDEDPSLVELLFQYGRYLLIACSRPGTQAANLQGIWNKDMVPAWDAAPHLNINLQMNYWPALPCNLKECQEPLYDYISFLSTNGRKTAKVNYEARGWVVHHISDIWAKTSPYRGYDDRRDVEYSIWQMGGAWICTHLWEHYTYTMDRDFLEKKIYPLLEGCTLFLLDWLIEGREGYLETNPSSSPEHYFLAPDGEIASLSYSTTMDMSIIREVFSAIVSAAKVLNKSEDELIVRVQKAQSRLYPTKIARDGSVMEWAKDFKDPDVHHRHLSHLFGLFPGHTITPEKTPDLCKAAENSLYKRGEGGPGWSTAWKIALWAHLLDSEQAYHMVKHLFHLVDPENEAKFEGGLYNNLFAAHPPFQIDANFGFKAAVSEMLVQSSMTDLYLLPTLPRDKWPNGCVKGLKARSDLTVSICWKEGELHEVGLWSKDHKTIMRLHYQMITMTATITSGRVYTFNKELKCLKSNALPNCLSS
ncbi:PREDICTED: alpha-L-fucosidase 2 [Ipomoea nil]|uniref:alpha-L-fucosidase 2 n=1 Tax=Ipomoea nil TaxID=35883 RepID=UPI000900EF5D|nr:PREDICTED: alpha-L-fucosidase 2 [Ipomoea nil]